MGIPHDTVIQLQNEGINSVDDLGEFLKEDLQQLADNPRRPGGRIQDPTPGAPAGATIPTPAFVFGAKSQKRIAAACEIVRYYNATGRALSAANMRWDPIIKNFDIQWKALKLKQDEDEPDVPKISKSPPIIPWSESFMDHLNRIIGVRTIPLSYITRAHGAEVPAQVPLLANGQPHSAEHGSVEAELIARASHDHPLFRDDNAKLYHALEESTRGTNYAPSIKPFQRAKDGLGAWTALTGQYCGKDKWEAEIKKQDDLLHNRIWRGQSNFSLEHFAAQHRNAYVLMSAGAEHVECQLPNEFTRVGHLLDAIQSSDPALQAAIAAIRQDDGEDGMRHDFERAVAKLLPVDPVARRRTSRKRDAASISDVDASEATVSVAKAGIGRTGVHLRWHTQQEFRALNDQQKAELKSWRDDNPDAANKSRAKVLKDGKGKGKTKDQTTSEEKKVKFSRKLVSSMVTKEVEKQIGITKNNSGHSDKDVDVFAAYVSSVIEDQLAKRLDSEKSTAEEKPSATGMLKSILRRAQNQGRKS